MDLSMSVAEADLVGIQDSRVWWEKTHGLLVEGGLTYAAIRNSVANSVIDFREGMIQLFDILEKNGVPILIFSAGLADIIEEKGHIQNNVRPTVEQVMRQKLNRNFKNVKVVSNRMVFDANGNLTGFRGKTIHVLNKNEHAIEMAAPIHDKLGSSDELDDNGASVVKDRTNVLLLGDHIGDLGMSNGLNYKNRISIAFLNDNVEKWVETYKQAFDIVLLEYKISHNFPPPPTFILLFKVLQTAVDMQHHIVLGCATPSSVYYL
eukprot:Gb_30867 [translate_table: standard]